MENVLGTRHFPGDTGMKLGQSLCFREFSALCSCMAWQCVCVCVCVCIGCACVCMYIGRVGKGGKGLLHNMRAVSPYSPGSN